MDMLLQGVPKEMINTLREEEKKKNIKSKVYDMELRNNLKILKILKLKKLKLRMYKLFQIEQEFCKKIKKNKS